MPHINVIYPFYPDAGDCFRDSAQEISMALKDLQPFHISLKNLEYFRHSSSSFTLWLNPETQKDNSNNEIKGKVSSLSASDSMRQLNHALVTVFPDCIDLDNNPEINITRYTPHLSIGQWKSYKAIEEAKKKFSSSCDITFLVDRVCLISRKNFNDPFQIRYEVLFNNSKHHIIEKNRVYIADQ